jgi:hypothetical protein
MTVCEGQKYERNHSSLNVIGLLRWYTRKCIYSIGKTASPDLNGILATKSVQGTHTNHKIP